MSLRTWIYSQLSSPDHEALYELTGDRVFAKKSMRSSVEEHPFLMYKLGNNTSEQLSEESRAARQFFQIYVHDYHDTQTGDYTKIDQIIALIKAIFEADPPPGEGVIQIQYLETSQDLDDNTLGTVFRYIRFVAITGG